MPYTPLNKLAAAFKEFADDVVTDVESLYKGRNQVTINLPNGIPNITDKPVLYSIEQTSDSFRTVIILDEEEEPTKSELFHQINDYVKTYVNPQVVVSKD